MKILKKALVASAILSAFATQAATVSSTPLKLSSEGVAAKVSATATTLTFDIVVDKNHPAASTITLDFDKNVEFFTSKLNCSSGSVTQVVGGGKAYCGDIGFNYGTGSFTFDNVVVTDGNATKGETDKITFDVNLGNALSADSAFRVILGKHDFAVAPNTGTDAILVSGASNLAYSSAKSDKTAIETGTGVIAQEVSQYGFVVTADLDGVIEREQQKSWVLNDVTQTKDSLGFTVSNDETLGLAILGSKIDVTFDGNFKDVTSFTSVAMNSIGTVAASDKKVVVELADSDMTGKAVVKTAIDFTNGTAVIPVTGDVSAKAVVVSESGTGTLPTGGLVIASSVDAGKWELDATVINVPYFPVLYTGTSTSVHFANESKKEADVIVTAIDNNGTEYGPLNLGSKLAAKTVTKVKQTDIATLFKIDTATKLSVTFNIDADKGDVNAYATVQSADGRSEVSTSQQRK
ncbi:MULTISPECIES: hypothetical protein [unclassified Pseudoalteromonas]|uniref:hypothetical protein n=1 Tax=unclassified Pseudoalteromonas TaxID=194690 RepID=UPI0005A962C2|nr:MULTISPECIES: hypothetical protein [unclassified Pseudoalteromonas]